MSYMLSLSLNIPAVELVDVGSVLAELARHGEIEDISMHRLTPIAESVQEPLQVANGGRVIEFIAADLPKRSRRKQVSNTPSGAMPEAEPVVAESTGSGNTDASTAVLAQAGVAAVGNNEGATSLPAESAVVAPSSNVTDAAAIPAIEVVRKFCADAVQADGTRRIKLTKLLAERGATSISALPEDQRAEFFTRVQEELK